MAATAKSLALSFGELTLPIECLDRATEQRLRAQLAKSGRQHVSLVLPPSSDEDVEGHAFAGALRSVIVHAKVGEAGSAEPIRIHFPSVQDADHFRRNLVAAGLLAGTVVFGSIGAAAVVNAPAPGTTTDANQIVQSLAASEGAARTDALLQGLQAPRVGGPLSATADQNLSAAPAELQAPRLGGPLSPAADQSQAAATQVGQAPRVGGPLSPNADQNQAASQNEQAPRVGGPLSPNVDQ